MGTNWGIFSKEIPGRVGYQCASFYRMLLKEGVIVDDKYERDESGQLHFKFKCRQQEENSNENPFTSGGGNNINVPRDSSPPSTTTQATGSLLPRRQRTAKSNRKFDVKSLLAPEPSTSNDQKTLLECEEEYLSEFDSEEVESPPQKISKSRIQNIHESEYYAGSEYSNTDVIGEHYSESISLLCYDSYGRCALHYAAYVGNVSLLSSFLKKFPVNKLDNFKRTPLHYAIVSGNCDVVRFLLKQKDCDANISDKYEMTPPHWASFLNLDSMLQIFYSLGKVDASQRFKFPHSVNNSLKPNFAR